MLQNPNQGNSTKHLVHALLITAVAILLVGGALIGLLNAQVAKVQRAANDKEAEVGSSEQVAQRYALTLSSYNDTLDHLKYLETSVTSASYMPTLLQQIQSLAQTTHLKVTSIRPNKSQAPSAPPPAAGSPTAPKKGPAYTTLSFSVEVTGTYPATAAFLYDLTRFPKIIAVTSAALHPIGAEADSNPLGPPQIHSTLQLAAYLFPDDGTPDVIPGLPPSAGGAGTSPSPTRQPGALPVSTASTSVRGASALPSTPVQPSVIPATVQAGPGRESWAPPGVAPASSPARPGLPVPNGVLNAARVRVTTGVPTL